MYSEASAKLRKRRRYGRVRADTTAIKRKDEINPMNMTTTVGKPRLGNGDRW